MVIVIYLVISFLFDGLISNYIGFQLNDVSYWKTIYTIVALVVVYDWFRNKNKYLWVLIIVSIIFDIRYTNTFILNTVVFMTIYLLNITLDNHLPNNIITINIKAYLSIILYNLMTYIILILANYNHYELYLLLKIIIRSLPMTLLYTSISYIVIRKIAPKKIK